jgi:hypothetical protein
MTHDHHRACLGWKAVLKSWRSTGTEILSLAHTTVVVVSSTSVHPEPVLLLVTGTTVLWYVNNRTHERINKHNPGNQLQTPFLAWRLGF